MQGGEIGSHAEICALCIYFHATEICLRATKLEFICMALSCMQKNKTLSRKQEISVACRKKIHILQTRCKLSATF